MDPSIGQVLSQVVGPNGAFFLLIAAVFGIWRGWIVPGWIYEEMRASRDKWEFIATRNALLADRITGTVEHVVSSGKVQ